MRVTKKYLTNWINAKMKELEIPLEVQSIEHTRLRSDDYEGGAAFYMVRMKELEYIGNDWIITYLIFHPMHQIESSLNAGWRLYFNPKIIGGSYILQDAEIGLTNN